jgi:N,N'-diacetyllegionaminate synthase
MDELFFIAEIGINHNGDLNLAKEMIDAAAQSGANAVKFQSLKASKLVAETEFSNEISGFGLDGVKTLGDFWKKVSIDEMFHIEVKNHCDKVGVEFFSTPFDLQSVDLLESLNVSKYKIASGDLTHFPLLKKVAQTGKEIILSTGGSYIDEISESYNYLKSNSKAKVSLLHCVSLYPTKPEFVNLETIEILKKHFNTEIGFSDHTLGIHIPLAAIARGATIIEKHFTLDKNMPGPDQAISTNPEELADLVRLGNEVFDAVKFKEKILSEDEIAMRPHMRRSIVAARDIKLGETINLDNIDYKRPGKGMSPKEVEAILGKKVNKSLLKDEKISKQLLF